MVDPVVDLLKRVKAIYTDDHFVYTSGKHGSVYINKDAMYQHPQETTLVCRLFAERHQDLDIDVVVGPAVGGIVLAQWTAYHLTELKGKEVIGAFTEKDARENQVFRRGYDGLVKNKKVLVVEDVTTTGGSVRKVIRSVRRAGGRVIAVCSMVNRDSEHVTTKTIDAPFSSLCIVEANAFTPHLCPMCKKHIPINRTIGHGNKLRNTHSYGKTRKKSL